MMKPNLVFDTALFIATFTIIIFIAMVLSGNTDLNTIMDNVDFSFNVVTKVLSGGIRI